MILSALAPKESAYVSFVSGSARQQHFYERLGFLPGTRVEILLRNRSGGVVRIMGTRVALSRPAMEEVEIHGRMHASACGQPELGEKHTV